MVRYYYYHRKDVDSEEVQFFDKSRASATGKECETNMEKEYEFPKNFKINRIYLIPEILVKNSGTAGDIAELENLKNFIQDGVIQIQVGDGKVHYYPVSIALAGVGATGSLQVTQATAGDGTYGAISIGNYDGWCGMQVDINVPENTDFKFYVKQSTARDIGKVEIILEGDIAEGGE